MQHHTDIVFFTLFRSDNVYSSVSLSMAKELAKRHRVFYVNHPYSVKDAFSGWRAGDPALRQRLPAMLKGQVHVEHLQHNLTVFQPRMTLPINWMPPGKVYDFFKKQNDRRVLQAIRVALQSFDVHDFVYINCYDPFFVGSLPDSFGARLGIYHCIDDISQNPYTAKHGVRLERAAAAEADLTFVTSTNLKKLLQPYARNIETFFNAADISVFSRVRTEKFPRPPELAGRTGAVIGFVGNMDELRVDYPLIKAVAEAHPDKTLLLVGPVNSPEPHTLGLDRMPNVVFAGPRRLDELPPLLQHMDVALIPFLLNTLTRSIYPLKINEYLAAGKPVVSTSFSDDIRSFGDVIYLSESPDAFVRNINRAIAEHNPERENARVQVAESNTWTARIAQLRDIAERYAGKTGVASQPA